MNVSLSSFENNFWTVNFGMKQTQKIKVYSIYQSELKLYKFITRKIHTKINTFITYEFTHELTIPFTKQRTTIYDCLQSLNVRAEPHEALETFYSRLRRLHPITTTTAQQKSHNAKYVTKTLTICQNVYITDPTIPKEHRAIHTKTSNTVQKRKKT